MSSFRADIAHGGEGRVVPGTRLDPEATRLGLDHIDLLKIDAEGYDLHVLRGAQRLLKEQRIDVIQFEYGEAWPYAGSTLSAAYQLLEGAGYQVFALKGEQLVKVDYQLYGEYFRYTNFVAARPAIATDLMNGR